MAAPKAGGSAAVAVGLRALPPQVCGLALGCNALGGLLQHWSKQLDGVLDPAPLAFSLVAAGLAAAYIAKLVLEPGCAWKDDLSFAPHLSAVSALPAAAQALAVRFGAPLPLFAVQGTIVLCFVGSLCIAARFLLLNYRTGSWPDPSWFPAVLLVGMTNVTAKVKGPEFLRDLVPAHFAAVIIVTLPLLAVVAYRILISKTRDSVAPSAGMALLMAPCSFSCFCYINLGMFFGEGLGMLLFAMSTAFFLLTLQMLYRRRSLWIKGFNLSYVGFTFPVVSTATSAVLASERFPMLQGQLLRSWAVALTALAVMAVSFVLLRVLLAVLPKVLGLGSASPTPASKTEGKGASAPKVAAKDEGGAAQPKASAKPTGRASTPRASSKKEE